MFARVVHFKFHPDKIDEGKRLFDATLAELQQQSGFRGAYLFGDPNDTTAMAVALWEREEDITERDENGFYQRQMARMKPALAVPPQQHRYEVRASTWRREAESEPGERQAGDSRPAL